MSLILSSYNSNIKREYCSYGQHDSCATGSYCVLVDDKNKAICKKRYEKDLPRLYFPFDRPVTCWKGIDHNLNSSHAWSNSRYAVDLYSNQKDINNIYAGLSGKIIARAGCKEKIRLAMVPLVIKSKYLQVMA